MIFGKDWSEKSHVGNVILGSDAFESQAPPNQCVAAEGLVDDKHLTVVLTPNLISSQLTPEDLHWRMKESVSLCGPGPQAYILVAQPQDFTEDDRKRVKMILTSVLDQALERTLVVRYLLEDEDVVGSSVDDYESDALRCLLQVCGGGCYRLNRKHEGHMQVEILEKIINIMTKDEKQSHSSHKFEDASETFQQQSQKPNPEIVSHLSKHAELKEKEKKSMKSKVVDKMVRWISPKAASLMPISASLPPMNLMLFGRKGIQRTSIGNIILSQSYSKLDSSSDFLTRRADVCGYRVTLVEVPSLTTTPFSLKELLKKSQCFISECAPGIHAFLLALPGGHFTDEDKEEIQKIQTICGPCVNDYITILFTNVSCPEGKAVQDSLPEETNLGQQYPKSCFVLSQEGGHEQISEMLKKIKGKSDKCFTTDMFVEAQIEERGRLQEIVDNMKQFNSSRVIQNPDSPQDCVRIVLIGKTGVGKSATGNTILQKDVFKSASCSRSVTTRCKKNTEQVNGRFVAVVDTPGLFDTAVSNEVVKKEILKCFSLLAPGPHVFLLLLSIGTRMTSEEKETLNLLKEIFGPGAEKFTITLFTKGDCLDNQSIEQYIEDGDREIEQLISDCEGRYHVFNNNDKMIKQVTELMEIIDKMVEKNDVGCYTSEMFQMAEAAVKEEFENRMRERELEIAREKEQLQAEFNEEKRAIMDEKTKEMQREREDRGKQLREREEEIEKELQRRDERERKEKEDREAEDKKRRAEEETQRRSWTENLKEVKQKHKEQKRKWEIEHKKQLKEEKAKATNKHNEWMEKQRKERSEFEMEQKKERRKREDDEKLRKKKEELEKRELEAKVKEAEKLTGEIHKERMKELSEWKDKRMKEKKDEQKEREQWEKVQKKMTEDFENEKEKAKKEMDATEEARKEQEEKERERIENEHAEQKEEMKRAQEKQEMKWTKAREEETDRRQKEDEENRRKITELQEEFEREKAEEKKKREKEDEDKEEEHKNKLKEIDEQNQKKIEMLVKKHKHEAREKAEEFNEFTKDLKGQHSLEIDKLRNRIKEMEDKYKNKCVVS